MKCCRPSFIFHNKAESGSHLLTHLTQSSTEQSGCDPHTYDPHVEVLFKSNVIRHEKFLIWNNVTIMHS